MMTDAEAEAAIWTELVRICGSEEVARENFVVSVVNGEVVLSEQVTKEAA